jgi:hypothetical protein
VTLVIHPHANLLYHCRHKLFGRVDNTQRSRNDVFSKKLKAGKRRTYFFDVRTTRNNDYFLTITESKKNGDDEQYERHKLFVYKEDLLKFAQALQDTIDHIRTELLPDYDFEAFSDVNEPEAEDSF